MSAIVEQFPKGLEDPAFWRLLRKQVTAVARAVVAEERIRPAEGEVVAGSLDEATRTVSVRLPGRDLPEELVEYYELVPKDGDRVRVVMSGFVRYVASIVGRDGEIRNVATAAAQDPTESGLAGLLGGGLFGLAPDPATGLPAIRHAAVTIDREGATFRDAATDEPLRVINVGPDLATVNADGTLRVLATTTWAAPADAAYLVTTANATLTGEVVVGATPNGELGGTWDAIIVDATHSGSAHSAYLPLAGGTMTGLVHIADLAGTGAGHWLATTAGGADRWFVGTNVGADTFRVYSVTSGNMLTITGVGIVDTHATGTLQERGSRVWTAVTLPATVTGKAVVAAADQAAGRSALGLGTMSTQAASAVAITGGTIAGITDLAVADGGTGASTGPAALASLGAVPAAGGTMTGLLVLSADPAAALGAATKQYVDSVAAGMDVKPSARVATTAQQTLSGAATIDGVVTNVGDRVLVRAQTAPAENGVWVRAAGAWTRATDMDAWAEVPGSLVFVEEGTLYADTAHVATANAGGTLGTTAITWSQFAGAGTYTAGSGLTLTGTQFSITAPIPIALGGTNSTTQAGARTQLGLGGMAVQEPTAVAITGGTITGITVATVTGALTIPSAVESIDLGRITFDSDLGSLYVGDGSQARRFAHTGEADGTYLMKAVPIGGGQLVYSQDSADIPLSVRGAPGQTADVFQIVDISGTVLLRVEASGEVGIGSGAAAATRLHLSTAADQGIRIESSTANAAFVGVYQNAMTLGVNRNTFTGGHVNTGKAAAEIDLFGVAADSYIAFLTASANNVVPTERMRLDKLGALHMRYAAGIGSGVWLDTSAAADKWFMGVEGTQDLWRVYSQTYGGNALTVAASGTVNVPSGLYEASSRVWTAATLVVPLATASIANDAVTYAKLQNVSATDRLLGRSTAGAGDVEEIVLTSFGRALIDDGSVAAQRTTLGLGTMAVEAAASYQLVAGKDTASGYMGLDAAGFLNDPWREAKGYQTTTNNAGGTWWTKIASGSLSGSYNSHTAMFAFEASSLNAANVGVPHGIARFRVGLDSPTTGALAYTDLELLEGNGVTTSDFVIVTTSTAGPVTWELHARLWSQWTYMIVKPIIQKPLAAADMTWYAAQTLNAALPAGTQLAMHQAPGLVLSGTAFPAAPALNDRFRRTDRGLEYFWDGTRWLSANLYTIALPQATTAATNPALAGVGMPFPGVYDVWIVSADLAFKVAAGGTALGASHYWSIDLFKQPGNASILPVTSFVINSGASDAVRNVGVKAIGALLATTNFIVEANVTKAGAPGNLTIYPTINYRLVG